MHKRRGLALSLVTNLVLLALLVFKSAPQPPVHRSGEPCVTIAPLIEPQPRRQQALAAGAASATAAANSVAAAGNGRGSSEPAFPTVPAGRNAWLVIGIPSAPRRGSPPYLQQTLESLLAEFPDEATDPLYGKVRVIVMDVAPGQNHAVTALRGRLKYPKKGDTFAAKAAAYIEILDSPNSEPDPTPDAPDPDDLHNPEDRPGRAVRAQTRNLVELLSLARHRGTYYMFMEDDFRVCPFMLRALHYVLAKAHTQQPSWLAIRLSYGMNGVLLRSSDLGPLIMHMRAGIARKPPDILWQEWATGDDRTQELKARPLMVYRYNMMAHIGIVSSFAVRMPRPAWPGCYAPMDKAWSLNMRERYNEGRCEFVSDLSPCRRPEQRQQQPGGGKQDSWKDFQLRWPAAAAGPPPRGRAVRPEGVLPAHVRQGEHGETNGRWLGGIFSRSSADSGASGSSVDADVDTAFTADAFATNFGRRPARKGGQFGGQLDGDTGIGSSLGTAFALDNE